MAGYNRTREVEELLQRTESKPPSFTVHLHPEYWSLNHGSKFLYNNHIASLLDDIRAHRIPVDFLEMFDTARVPFYDGCMIVELLDYRPQKQKDTSLDKPDRTRVVLHPDSETLWADICLLNKKHGQTWTDMDALEAEARILLATSPPLCLDPNPHLTRIANHILRVSTPAVPNSLKRKAAELEREEDEVEKTRRHKLMSFMSPRSNPPQTQTQPSQYRLLETIQRLKQAKEMASSQPAPPPSQPNIPLPNLVVNTTIPTQSVSLPASARSSLPPSPQKPATAIKQDERASNSPHPRSSVTPLPQIHPQLTQPPSASSPAALSPASHQPVNGQYTNGVDHRAPTPSQTHYTQSPRVPSAQPNLQPPTHTNVPTARPPSAQTTHPPRPQSRVQVQPHPPQQPQQQPISRPPTAQPQVSFPVNPQGHFMQNSPALRQATATPQNHQPTAAQLAYLHQMQHQQQQQQARLAAAQQQALQQQQQNGRSTPQPAIANVASPANRSVPLSRSMTPQQTPVQLPPHLAQHAQAQHIQALRQNPQYAAQLAAAAAAANGARASGTPLPANVAQQQALLQAQAQAQAQAGNSQQQQMQGQGQSVPVMAYPQMYNYQMGLMRQGMQGMAGVPASYWMARMPTMVNGMANGQAMPGMPQAANGANPQALGVGVQKAGQAGQAR